MYLLLVSPLSHVVVPAGEDPALGTEFVRAVQRTLAEVVGSDVSWDDAAEVEDSLEAEELELDGRHALRVAALYLELEGSLEGFDPGDEPWDHPLLEEAEERGGSKQFPQLVHGEAELVAFVPLELEDCYRLVPEQDPDDDEPDGDVAVGSLPALQRELAVLGEGLGLPPQPELSAELASDEAADHLGPARLACALMMVRAAEAAERGLPLVIAWLENPDDLESDDPANDG